MFHRIPSGALTSVPSRMSMQEKRDFHKSHAPEWVLKSVTKPTSSPTREFIQAAIKGFGMAFVGKTLVSIVFALLGKRKNFIEILKQAVGLDTLRFSTFFALYCGLLRGLVNQFCIYRRGVNDRWNAIFAGALAGLALLIDDVERRRIIAVYIFVRAMSVLVKGLSREKILPYNPHAETILFGIVNMPIMHGFLLEPDILDQGYYRWILNMGNVTHEGLDLTLRTRYHVNSGEVHLPFHPCQPHYHTGSCVGYCSHDWFLGLGRAAKIYAPVHILPLLIFRYNKLLKDPAGQVLSTAKALAYSCMFLTTYQFNVKFSQCMLRNARQTDDMPQALFAGLVTGFACLFETPSRISELMLYCVPKAMEACWNYGVKHFGFTPVPYFEVPLFMVGSAVLVSTFKEDLRTTYFNALSFIVTGEFKSSTHEKQAKRQEEPQRNID